MVDETPVLKNLHDIYIRKTGRAVTFDCRRMEAWRIWMSHKWEPWDLDMVICYLKKLIAAKRRWEQSLNFHCLIENTSNFEELLAEARCYARVPNMDKGKAEVLKATGRLEPLKAKPRSAEEIMRDEAAFKAFQQFRQSL